MNRRKSRNWRKDAQALLEMGATTVDSKTVRGLLDEMSAVETELRKTLGIEPSGESLLELARKVQEDHEALHARLLVEDGPRYPINAPWTHLEVENLRKWQAEPGTHPFTAKANVNLIPTRLGWTEVKGGPVVQEGAWSFQLDGSHLKNLHQLMVGTGERKPDGNGT